MSITSNGKKIRLILLGIILCGTGAYLLGPAPSVPNVPMALPEVPTNASQLEAFISKKESSHPSIKKDNDARIVWADQDAKQKTRYSLLYLHGFSASWKEGEPAHLNIAKRYGMNLFLHRMHKHGLDTADAMIDFTAEGYLESAKEGLAIASSLGDSVIIMSTSTGGTAAIWLASRYPQVAGLINYSPNIEIADPTSFILDNPWGVHIARMVLGNKFYSWEADPYTRKYWTNKYRIEALAEVQNLVAATMKESVFEKVDQPFFMGYYYKNEEEQDQVVRVDAMLEMFEQLGTPENKKVKVAFPDAEAHVLCNDRKSKSFEEVVSETNKFIESQLRQVPINIDSSSS